MATMQELLALNDPMSQINTRNRYMDYLKYLGVNPETALQGIDVREMPESVGEAPRPPRFASQLAELESIKGRIGDIDETGAQKRRIMPGWGGWARGLEKLAGRFEKTQGRRQQYHLQKGMMEAQEKFEEEQSKYWNKVRGLIPRLFDENKSDDKAVFAELNRISIEAKSLYGTDKGISDILKTYQGERPKPMSEYEAMKIDIEKGKQGVKKEDTGKLERGALLHFTNLKKWENNKGGFEKAKAQFQLLEAGMKEKGIDTAVLWQRIAKYWQDQVGTGLLGTGFLPREYK